MTIKLLIDACTVTKKTDFVKLRLDFKRFCGIVPMLRLTSDM